MRTGNCKLLLIAPHGHPKNDEKTYDITRLTAEELNSYAIVTKTYRKPYRKEGTSGLAKPNKDVKEINLNRQNQVQEHLESEFEKPQTIEIGGPGGAVLMGPSCQVLPSTSGENFKAWVDATHKYGKYPM